DPLPNTASYEERKANKDYRLEEVLECLCLEGREWVRHKDGRPHFLRRNDLDVRINYSIVKGEELCSSSMRKKDENRVLSRELRP
ncbi:hypothetical protein PIB30_106380, partial [Stylosanthes scabra]|nr:hypothetical protein [Stylosanthes scabra]